ncbi:MAG: hypothetical protein ABIO81_13790 [Ginsengibacter sp.]
MRLKRLIFILVAISAIIALANISCKKEKPYMNNAEIIGADLRLCPCCGGHKITIDNVLNPNNFSYFLVAQLPAGFDLGDNPKYPIVVKIDWDIDTLHCYGNFINISRIARK